MANYEEYRDIPNIEFVVIDHTKLEYRGICTKRKYILSWCIVRGIDRIFMLDDDISPVFSRTVKQPEKKCGKRVPVDLVDCLKLLAYKTKDLNDFGIAGFNDDGLINFWDRKITMTETTRAYNAILLNITQIRNANVMYDTKFKVSEDFDFIIQILDKGLRCYSLLMIGIKFVIKSGGKNTVSGSQNMWRYYWLLAFKKWRGYLDLIHKDDTIDGVKGTRILTKRIKARDDTFKDKDHITRFEHAMKLLDQYKDEM